MSVGNLRLSFGIAVVAAVVGTVACDTATDRGDVRAADAVRRSVDVGGSETDIFLPGGADADGDAPVVVMLHGTGGDRGRMEPLARAVAADGALVYVPDWPVIDQVAAFPEERGDAPFREQSEAVVCALRHIRRTAAADGGDPSDLTVVGFSGGGMIGARVAIVDEVPWPGIDCDAGIDHRPTRFIGLAGDYKGTYQYGAHPGYAPYDVLSLNPTNRDLEVWLLNGHNDRAVGVHVATLFAEHLSEAGIDAGLLTTDMTHGDAVDTTTPAGRFVAERISALVRGVDEPTWWPADVADASLTFGPDESCSYVGPDSWPTDRTMTIGLVNGNEFDASFFLVSVDADATIDDLSADGGFELGWDHPDWVDWFGGRAVPAEGVSTMPFAFVDGTQQFVLSCFTNHASDRVRAGWMYPAALLAPDG